MDEHLFIVVYRHCGEPWQAKTSGLFTERRLAENFIECCKATGFSGELAIVDGPIYSPESMAEAEARLGKF